MLRSEADFPEYKLHFTSESDYILVLCSENFALESLGAAGCRAVGESAVGPPRVARGPGAGAGSGGRERGGAKGRSAAAWGNRAPQSRPGCSRQLRPASCAARWPGTRSGQGWNYSPASGYSAELTGQARSNGASTPPQEMILIIMVPIITTVDRA